MATVEAVKVLTSHGEGVVMLEGDAHVREGCQEDLK